MAWHVSLVNVITDGLTGQISTANAVTGASNPSVVLQQLGTLGGRQGEMHVHAVQKPPCPSM